MTFQLAKLPKASPNTRRFASYDKRVADRLRSKVVIRKIHYAPALSEPGGADGLRHLEAFLYMHSSRNAVLNLMTIIRFVRHVFL